MPSPINKPQGPTGPPNKPPPTRPGGTPPPAKITFRVGRGVPMPKRRRPFGVRLAIYTIEFGALITGAMTILAIAA